MWVDSLAQTYHWSYAEIVRLSMAQVVMLTHAGGINSDRMQARMKTAERQSEGGSAPVRDDDDGETPTFLGKPIDQLNSDEYMRYLSS